jgi:hypothetical protein
MWDNNGWIDIPDYTKPHWAFWLLKYVREHFDPIKVVAVEHRIFINLEKRRLQSELLGTSLVWLEPQDIAEAILAT